MGDVPVIRAAVRRLFFDREEPENLAMARVLLGLTALWIVLSRHDLPSLLTFPRAIWETIPTERRIRFAVLLPLGLERALWWLLHATLLATIAGLATRWMALASGLLLYHFASFETIFWSGNPYLRGFTIPALGLLIVAASASGGAFRPRGASEASWEHRWPLALIQMLFAQIYFFAAWAKLVTSGVDWMFAPNIQRYVLALDQVFSFPQGTFGGNLILRSTMLATATGVCGLLLDALFPMVLFSRRARRVILPLAAFFHLANGLVFHIWFQNAWLLLLFVDWAAVARAGRMRRWSASPSS
jgi:hypothetical protein